MLKIKHICIKLNMCYICVTYIIYIVPKAVNSNVQTAVNNKMFILKTHTARIDMVSELYN
jgi:hypothetical protein